MLIIKLALRNILRNRRRSILTILSMGGGYLLLSLSLSMLEGSYNNMIDRFTEDHTGHIQIHKSDYFKRPSLYKTINNFEQLIKKIKQSPDIISVTPRIYGSALVYANNKTFPSTLIGIDPDLEASTTFLKSKVIEGTYLDNAYPVNSSSFAMIGKTLANNLHLTIGDELILISQGIDGSIANDTFNIVSIVGTTESHERMNIYLTLKSMREFLSMENKVHELAIKISDHTEAIKLSQQLQSNLQDKNLQVKPWQEIEEIFYKSMQADKQGNYVSMGIIIFIVSIGVLNTVLMGTLERTREFGVLKAIGTRPFSIFKLIMLESLFLSFASCIFGFILALPANYWLATVGITMPEPIDMGGVPFESMLGEVSWFSMGLPVLVVVISTLIISLIPSIRAAQISPLLALQAT